MIKIVITDDHPLTREGLKNRISRSAKDMKVIGEAASAGELLKILSNDLPDIVVLDITMPDKSGLEILKEIRPRYPELKVLVLSMHPEERYAVRMVRAGASGYLTKDNENLSTELLKAIRLIVLQNKRYFSPAVIDLLVQDIDSNDENNHRILSGREWQVLLQIASGKKIREIADEMAISVQTVHTYKNRTLNKLNLNSVADLTRYAIQHNLID